MEVSVSHAFDSGLAIPQRTLIRRAAVSLLSQLKQPTGYLLNVKAIGGIVRSYTDEPDIQRLIKECGPSPSIGVQLATRQFETLAIGGKQAKSNVTLLLYFVSQHSRDVLSRHEADVEALANDHKDPGLDIMMEHAIELMHGQYPSQTNLTVKQIQIQREEELVTLPEVCIWLQTYQLTTQTYTGSKEFRTAEQLIDSIHWRTTTDQSEPLPPDPAVAPTTIDVNSDP
jgi:hypothetical protein